MLVDYPQVDPTDGSSSSDEDGLFLQTVDLPTPGDSEPLEDADYQSIQSERSRRALALTFT